MATTRQQLHLKLPPQLRSDIVKAAGKQGVSINRFCEFGLATYLQFLQADNPPGSDRARPPSRRRT